MALLRMTKPDSLLGQCRQLSDKYTNWRLSGCLKNYNENQPRGISRKHIRTFVSEFRKFDVPHEPLRTASTRCVLANFGYLRKLIYAKIFGVTSNFRNRSYDCFLKMPRGRFCQVCATFKHFSEAQICEINWRNFI